MSHASSAGLPRGKRLPRLAEWLDWSERFLVLALYAWLVARLLGAYVTKGSLVDLMLLPSEGLVVFLMLIRRRPRDISPRPGDWILALGATTAPLLANPALERALLSPPVGATIMLMGMLVQVHAKLALGRSMGCVAAHRGLRFCGPYQYVRHPMYLGYLLTHVGFLLMNPSLGNLGVYALCYSLQVPRLLAEERLLRQDPLYLEYAGRVRYRLIPGIF